MWMRLADIVYFGYTKTLNLEELTINFETAFNSANHKLFIWILEKFGFRRDFIKWM